METRLGTRPIGVSWVSFTSQSLTLPISTFREKTADMPREKLRTTTKEVGEVRRLRGKSSFCFPFREIGCFFFSCDLVHQGTTKDYGLFHMVLPLGTSFPASTVLGLRSNVINATTFLWDLLLTVLRHCALQPESPRLLSTFATGLCRQSRMKSTLIKV